MSWTHAQDRMLSDFYAQYDGAAIPIRDIASVLGKPSNTVRGRALKLGLTQRNRPSPLRIYKATPCPICGTEFTPVPAGGRITQTCSQSCGQTKRINEGRHARGMTGKSHSDATRVAIGAKSVEFWAEMPAADRQIRSERMRTLASGRAPTDRTYTRSRGGRRADLGGLYVRSSWEANYARWLNYRRDVAADVHSWEYEPRTFDFPVKRGTTSYTPDFLVTFAGGRNEWHEVKGWLTQRGATALKRFARYYPNETLVLIDEPTYRSIAKQASRLVEGWE